MDRVVNRQTTWYVINIKARRNQTPQHYVDAWNLINEQDPLIELPKSTNRFASVRTMSFSQQCDNDNIPHYINTKLVAYTLIDPERFYNRRTKEDMAIDWNTDIAANKKESELIFVPSVHTLVVKKSSEITINYILTYLQGALNIIEPEGFDVDLIKDRETLDQILHAHALISIDAHISFSNPGHTDGFQEIFENKIRDANPDSFDIKINGTQEHPLYCQEDGLIKSIINLSESNGNVKAVVQKEENSGLEVIDTEDHPFILKLPHIINDICSTLYNELRTRYANSNSNE